MAAKVTIFKCESYLVYLEVFCWLAIPTETDI